MAPQLGPALRPGRPPSLPLFDWEAIPQLPLHRATNAAATFPRTMMVCVMRQPFLCWYSPLQQEKGAIGCVDLGTDAHEPAVCPRPSAGAEFGGSRLLLARKRRFDLRGAGTVTPGET